MNFATLDIPKLREHLAAWEPKLRAEPNSMRVRAMTQNIARSIAGETGTLLAQATRLPTIEGTRLGGLSSPTARDARFDAAVEQFIVDCHKTLDAIADYQQRVRHNSGVHRAEIRKIVLAHIVQTEQADQWASDVAWKVGLSNHQIADALEHLEMEGAIQRGGRHNYGSGEFAWLIRVTSLGRDLAERSVTPESIAVTEKGASEPREIEGDGFIFVGHGNAADWLVLEKFLKDRLHLTVRDFRTVSPAGIATKERLQQLLGGAMFAFLVMTAEDATIDGEQRARENVVHEAGLFQGRLGFERAIVLLEDGCSEFSNIHGIGQIRFAKGKLHMCFEDVRQVLEREKIIQS